MVDSINFSPDGEMRFREASFLPNERIYFKTGLRNGRELERELSKMHSSSADPVQMRQLALHGLQMLSEAVSCS